MTARQTHTFTLPSDMMGLVSTASRLRSKTPASCPPVVGEGISFIAFIKHSTAFLEIKLVIHMDSEIQVYRYVLWEYITHTQMFIYYRVVCWKFKT